jgi:hypothetical protein
LLHYRKIKFKRVTEAMTNQNKQLCPVCGVSIAENGLVNFSTGKPGTRARLYARVCQYTDKNECINQDPELIGEITSSDGFLPQ